MLKLWLGENEDAKLKNLARSMKKDIASGREVVAIIPQTSSIASTNPLFVLPCRLGNAPQNTPF